MGKTGKNSGSEAVPGPSQSKKDTPSKGVAKKKAASAEKERMEKIVDNLCTQNTTQSAEISVLQRQVQDLSSK